MSTISDDAYAVEALMTFHERLFHGRGMLCSSSIPVSWVRLASRFFDRLDNELNDEEASALNILQIKEKLGKLRIYARFEAPLDDFAPSAYQRLGSIIDCFETESQSICVRCGGAGTIVAPEIYALCGRRACAASDERLAERGMTNR